MAHGKNLIDLDIFRRIPQILVLNRRLWCLYKICISKYGIRFKKFCLVLVVNTMAIGYGRLQAEAEI